MSAAYQSFLERGAAETTLEDICERADVANRTFFNHFPTRIDMMRALSERRLAELQDVVFEGSTELFLGRVQGVDSTGCVDC